MSRINPWSQEFAQPELAQPVTRTLTAPKCPSLTLTLRPMDEFARGEAEDKYLEYVARHIGTRENPGTPLMGGDAKLVRLSKSLLSEIAAIEVMEVVPEGEEPYGLIGWVGWIRRFRPLWRKIKEFSGEVQRDYDAAEGLTGNSTAAEAPTGNDSTSPSA